MPLWQVTCDRLPEVVLEGPNISESIQFVPAWTTTHQLPFSPTDTLQIDEKTSRSALPTANKCPPMTVARDTHILHFSSSVLFIIAVFWATDTSHASSRAHMFGASVLCLELGGRYGSIDESRDGTSALGTRCSKLLTMMQSKSRPTHLARCLLFPVP